MRGRALKDALPEKALVSRSPRGVQPLPEAGREEIWKLRQEKKVVFGWSPDWGPKPLILIKWLFRYHLDDDDDDDDSMMIPNLYIGKWLLYNNHFHPLKELVVWSPKFFFFGGSESIICLAFLATMRVNPCFFRRSWRDPMLAKTRRLFFFGEGDESIELRLRNLTYTPEN